MWVPDPSQIVRLQATGHGDMGDVTDESSVARFSLPDGPYVLCFIRGKFTTLSGTGVANATMSLKVDHCDPSGIYDFTLKTWPDIGTFTGGKADINTRIAADELYQWVIGRDGVLVTEWANPDAGNIRWALEVGLAYAP